MKNLVILLITGLLICLITTNSHALRILPSDFGAESTIEDFDAAVPSSLPPGGMIKQSTPLILSGITYSTSSPFMRVFYGTHTFCFESAIGTDSSSGYIDIVFDVPVLRAGAWVGASGARADFFSDNNYLLGSVVSSLLAPEMAPEFLGWETDSYLIKLIRFTDIEPEDGTVLVLDRLTSELGAPPLPGTPPSPNTPVPEPSVFVLVGTGLVGIFGIIRTKKLWLNHKGYKMDVRQG